MAGYYTWFKWSTSHFSIHCNSLSVRQVRRRENAIKVKSVLLMPVSSFVVWFTVLTVLRKVHLLLQARNQFEYVISVLRTSHQAQPRYIPLILFTAISKKVVGENGERGECRTEVAWPKGTVVTLFEMQNFISCVHLAWKWIHQLWTFVWGFLTPND